MKDSVIGVLASDLHLSPTPPLMRLDKNWLKVQKGYLDQLSNFRQDLFTPLIIAGDILHTWYVSPEFINFLLEYFPECYAVPGQHDLPHHRIEDIRKSAYWTLVKAGRIKQISTDGSPTQVAVDGHFGKLRLFGFPYGSKIKPCKYECREGQINLAVCHAYIWTKGNCFPGAPPSKRLKKYLRSLKGYHAALFGDNHKGFLYKAKGLSILNSGTFLRRTTDEIPYKPRIGLLYESGNITVKYLDTSKDRVWKVKVKSNDGEVLNLEAFIEDLESLSDTTVDVDQAVKRYLDTHDVDDATKEHILKLLSRREK